MSKGTENDDAGVVPGVDEDVNASGESSGESSETVWPVWGSTAGRPTASAARAAPTPAGPARPDETDDEPRTDAESLDETPVADAEPADAEPADTEPADAEPAESEPVDTELAEAEPVARTEPTAEALPADAAEPSADAVDAHVEVVDADAGDQPADEEAEAELAEVEADPADHAAGAPDHVAQDEVAPDEVAQDEVAPDEVAPDEVAQDEVAQDEVAQDEVSQDEVAPDEVAQDEVAPDEVAPEDGVEAEVEAAGAEQAADEAPAEPVAGDAAGPSGRPAGHQDLDLAAATAAYAAALAAAQTPEPDRDAPTERMAPVPEPDAESDTELDEESGAAPDAAAPAEPAPAAAVEAPDEVADDPAPEPVPDPVRDDSATAVIARTDDPEPGPEAPSAAAVPAATSAAPTRTSVRPPAGAPRPGVPAPAEPTERIARTAAAPAAVPAAAAAAAAAAPPEPAPVAAAPVAPPAPSTAPSAAPGARQRIDGGPVPPTPRNPSPLDDFESDDRPSRAPRVLAVLGIVVLLLVGGYVAASFAFGDKVPRGATVAGVPIGGLARGAAVERLQDELQDVTTGPVEVVAHDVQASIEPAKAGLAFDAEATVDGLVGTDLLEPARLWRQVAGVGAVTPSTTVDDDALAAAIEELGGSLSAEPVDAGIVFVDGSASTTKAEDGWTVDADAAARTLAAQWLTAAPPIELPTTTVEPAITQAEADEAYDTVAKHVGSAPVSVEVDERVAVLDPETVVANAAMVPVDGALQLQMNGEKLADEVVDQLPDLLTAAEDAHFTFEDGKPKLVEGEAGTKIDPATLATAVAKAAAGSDRTATVELVPTDPEDTTKAMEELGITEVVSEFKTPLTSEQRRTTNIRQGLKNLTGVLVRPGEDFSLTESLGPIDAQHGFVQAGVIVNGEHQDGIGGGLSQVSTTTFNAAFFAGFEILEHQPHSEWFQRYPEGREATMYLGSIDMRFKNDSPYGALIRGWVSGGYAHVQVWSTKYYDVATTTGPRSNVVSPRTVYSQSPTCVPQSAGNPGFRVTVNRTVTTASDGKVKEKNSWTTTYRPQNRVVCGKAPSAEKDEEKKASD